MKFKMGVLFWLFCAVGAEGFSVQGPAMPLLVQLGASVTLPCSVDTPLPLHTLEVEWKREDSGALVHLFQGGESRPESQSPPYSGRAEFFTEEISKGNYSLLLKDVTTEDKGLYKCVVHTDHESHEAKVKIDIERLVVTGADGPVFAYAGGDVILNCSVDTHIPLRELEVEWIKTNGEILVLLFSEGQSRPESQHERFSGRAEFFSEEIPKGNFSLKLRDVKTEDRGEFMCKVHTDRESVNATAWLQDQGFSTLHMCVLGLTTAAGVFAVLSCIPAVWSIKKEQKNKNNIEKDKSSWAVFLYCLQVSVPCILLSIAFAIWGISESSAGETFICIALNLLRILMIFKVAPYVPGKCLKKFNNVAVPLESLVITTGMNSVLLHKFLTDQAPDTGRKTYAGFMFATVLLWGLYQLYSQDQRISFGSRKFDLITHEIFFLAVICSAYGLSGVLFFWFFGPSLFFMLSRWKMAIGQRYSCSHVLGALNFIVKKVIMLILLRLIFENDKESPALICFCAFLMILNKEEATSELPAVPHILVYVFGSAGLSVINSVALAVFLKKEKGERTVEDLRVIVLPFETLFWASWLGLNTYYKQEEKTIRQELGPFFQSCKGSSPTPQQSQMQEKDTGTDDGPHEV